MREALAEGPGKRLKCTICMQPVLEYVFDAEVKRGSTGNLILPLPLICSGTQGEAPSLSFPFLEGKPGPPRWRGTREMVRREGNVWVESDGFRICYRMMVVHSQGVLKAITSSQSGWVRLFAEQYRYFST